MSGSSTYVSVLRGFRGDHKRTQASLKALGRRLVGTTGGRLTLKPPPETPQATQEPTLRPSAGTGHPGTGRRPCGRREPDAGRHRRDDHVGGGPTDGRPGSRSGRSTARLATGSTSKPDSPATPPSPPSPPAKTESAAASTTASSRCSPTVRSRPRIRPDIATGCRGRPTDRSRSQEAGDRRPHEEEAADDKTSGEGRQVPDPLQDLAAPNSTPKQPRNATSSKLTTAGSS